MTARDDRDAPLPPMSEPQPTSPLVVVDARQIAASGQVSPRRAALRRFLRYRLAIVGVVLLSAIVLMAILAPVLTPWPPNFIDFDTGARQPPNPAHLLGTDVSGRDIWARVLYGGRTSTIVGFGAVALYLVIGTLF